MKLKKLKLFEGIGVEVEYMIVADKDLHVLPIADTLLSGGSGKKHCERKFGRVAWSNELSLHVIEIKTLAPMTDTAELPRLLQPQIKQINSFLAKHQAKLLPGGAHPFMDPLTETQVWPHGNRMIYKTYDRIFNCSGHGWANLQSTHLNISFSNDQEFSRLHAAVRFLLPLLPALAASSPLIEGKATGSLDNRMLFYAKNQKKFPRNAGKIIPEANIKSRKDYETRILMPMYKSIAKLDPQKRLQYEWLNSRGAIARFERYALEIKLLDCQECLQAETAVCAFIIAALKFLVNEQTISFSKLSAWPNKPLLKIYADAVRKGLKAVCPDTAYLKAWGIKDKKTCGYDKIIRHIIGQITAQGYLDDKAFGHVYDLILSQGNLSQRILRSLNKDVSRENIIRVYQRLADCLEQNKLFEGK
ncbi:MAG: glutamate--cysteine ligase [Candidatus Omnitrophica bacterium]|nr:glutamate--cysteine ligase [Candidatus Omnitrophota bacterium]